MQTMVTSVSDGKLFLLTGPSGVGKGTLIKTLLSRHPEIWLSISATTRQPRDGEIDARHYYFMSRAEFSELASQGGFLEWAEFAGNFYGTPSKEVRERLSSGRPVLLEIELEGARQVRGSFPEALQIFVAPPSFEELERRIRGRATDSEEAIAQRLFRANEELSSQNEFDAIVINDDLQRAIEEIERLIGLVN